MIHLVLAAALTAPPAHDTTAIDQTKYAALEEDKFAFCTDPSKPFGPRQRATCATAHELENCQGLIEACDGETAPSSDWLARLVELLAPVAHLLLYAMILVILVAVAIPVIGALRQLRRRRRRKDEEPAAPNVAQLVTLADAPPPDETDPEEALRQAEAFLARGEYRRALSFSLAASLGALGRRGAIRLGRHRTNGEYLRSCAEEAARPPLREIVRAVDAVEFGGAEATSEKASNAAARARQIVMLTALVLLLFGCAPPKRGADPAGDELPIAVLARNGYDIKPLGSSLATLPVPENDEGAPVVVIDTEKVPLESETQAHLLRWTEAGGVLVLFGRPSGWPAELQAKERLPETRDVTLYVPDPNEGLGDPESDEPAENDGKPIRLTARIARKDAFTWKTPSEQVLAYHDRGGHTVYASKRPFGRGLILGVANDDLFTNVGVMPKNNAAALVTLIRSVSHDMRRRLPLVDGKVAIGDLRVAKAEDGIPPPSNPFAALIAAGLGKGAWHALVAAILLFLCYGIRHARPRAAPGAPRRAFVEHVAATGAFYARAPARSHALASYGRFVELRLRELAPRGTDPAAFLASRTGADAAHITKLLSRALEARLDEVPKGDELDVIAELRALVSALDRPRSGP